MIPLPPDFKEFLQLLKAHDVQYMLIGGYAVAYHGYPRATVDLDIWVAIDPLNAERIARTLREFGFDLPEVDASLFFEPEKVVRMGIPPIRLKLITSISGVTFEACFANREIGVVDGVEINIISLSRSNFVTCFQK